MAMSLKDEFDAKGYVRIDGALSPVQLADLRHRMDEALAGREIRSTMKLGDDREAADLVTTAPLRAAFNALLGSGSWLEPLVLEDLRIKFPAPPEPLWWHIDVFEHGVQTSDEDVLSWRASPRCGGVGLLVLLLLSDVSRTDAATAMRVGSHRTVARYLDAAGEDGLSLGELLDSGIDVETADASIDLTIGSAGTAFLCHPMLVHAALPHTGASQSYWALPAIRLAENEPQHAMATQRSGSLGCNP
jgi:hypothetical protein